MPILTGNTDQSEWVKVLSKGLITIPKAFRDALGLKEGGVAQVKKWGRRLIIEPREIVGYEVYDDEEFEQMLVEDKLPEDLGEKVQTPKYGLKVGKNLGKIIKNLRTKWQIRFIDESIHRIQVKC